MPQGHTTIGDPPQAAAGLLAIGISFPPLAIPTNRAASITLTTLTPDPAGVVVGHVAGGMAGRQARPSCHLVDGVVAGVALVRPPKQPQGTPSRCLVLQREAFEDDQRFRAARDSGVGSSTMDWPVVIWATS